MSERTFNNYARGLRQQGTAAANNSRYGPTVDKRKAFHDFEPKTLFQRYGNSYLISIPRRKCLLVIGPHWPGVLITVFIIWFGTWLNLRLLAKQKDFSELAEAGFKAFITFFTISTHILLFCTATTDPGIIFKSECTSEKEEFNLNDAEYCEVCEVYQPDERHISHCSDCNYCIDNMDHHCPWMVSYCPLFSYVRNNCCIVNDFMIFIFHRDNASARRIWCKLSSILYFYYRINEKKIMFMNVLSQTSFYLSVNFVDHWSVLIIVFNIIFCF